MKWRVEGNSLSILLKPLCLPSQTTMDSPLCLIGRERPIIFLQVWLDSWAPWQETMAYWGVFRNIVNLTK
jgi:hypothetical protein